MNTPHLHQYVVLCAWPSLGLRVYGPFDSKPDALQLGDMVLSSSHHQPDWWVTQVSEEIEIPSVRSEGSSGQEICIPSSDGT